MGLGSLRERIISGRLWRTIAGRVALALLVVGVVAGLAPTLSFIEVRALDVLYALRPEGEPDPRIEIIDVGDDPTPYEHLRHPQDSATEGCKIPRLAYAEAVRLLSEWGARVIVFDLMFKRPCKHEDHQLAEAFEQAGNVVVAAVTKTKPGAVGLEDPVDPIDKAVRAVGSPVALQPNETVRSIPLLVRDRDTGRKYLALCLVAFQRFRGAGPQGVRPSQGRWLVTGGSRIPVLSGEKIYLLSGGAGEPDASSESGGEAFEVIQGENVEEIPGLVTWNTMLLNWAGPEGTIRPHHLSDLLTMDDDARGREMFEGKAVIIGQADWDAHWTAVGPMPGLEVQANALHTLMSGHFIHPISPWAMIGLLVAFSLTTSFAVHRFRGVRAVGVVALLMAVALLIARQLLTGWGIWMYLFYCELGIGLTWGATTVAESDKVTALLGRFVPSFIQKPEVSGPREVRTMDASILFSDIRNYTGIAEKLSAADTLTMLNAYQTTVEDIIARHGGTIVKTPGDAVLAVFWKDLDDVNHATCALQSAQEMLDDLPIMGRVWETAGVSLAIGIGIDAGSVAMGLVGRQHLEPTVIGDAVNVAQRLETLTKTLDCPLVFSENVRERLGENVETVCFDEVTVRGRETPLKVYGLVRAEGLKQELGKSADPVGKENTE
jgi:class 3 adenylate cyclase